ncbi:type II toxin-antitoxin system death-on-curing family toxin [Novosphingobium cyanobacteriorum]|uniref:Type II toxin-antitoxin system death-on-curing family toxin n=1 Tax=Novosphingobium cyanobacteriorum TaxID=3024215 RepID=A0ABT6CLM3_9SPHN|nr:type II toxin-antitoxin system death-on-curing family toxin [Novosphingobium cyanobacteriorum]MDF8333960.1 type II toxin-antitoxin system death-on-curing family toxin [Novosphingobium cyanobacteriorum]
MSLRLEPVWLDSRLALAIHDRQLAEHGGPSGVRDSGALESALARPCNQWEYGEDDLCQIAAAHAFGIARNHPFTDGNKRTAWVIARTFLVLNSVEIAFAAVDAVATAQALAAGDLTEDELAHWFRQHIRTADT